MDTEASAQKLRAAEDSNNKLQEEVDDLNHQLSQLQDKLTMAEAKSSSVARQLQDADEARAEAESRAYQVQVEFQRVLLNTEQYYKNKQSARSVAVDTVFTPRANDAPAMQNAQRQAVAAAVAVRPNGGFFAF